MPAELQRTLYTGRHRAKAYKQDIYWDTCNPDKTIEGIRWVYTELYGEERANGMMAKMARAKKDAEAKARLEEGA